jgi:type IV secretory pathway TrbD component
MRVGVRIYRSGNRPILLLGGDFYLVSLLMMTAGVVAYVMTTLALVTAALLWVVGLWAIRKMAKADPRMRAKGMRCIGYRPYYPPRSAALAPSYRTPLPSKIAQ